MLQGKTDRQNYFSDELKGFHPVILRNDSGFCVYLPEWKVSGAGPSLEEAYQQFFYNFKAVEAHAKDFGLAALTPDPYPVLKGRAVFQELTLFFIKVAASAFIVILLVVLLLPNIAAALRHNLKEMVPKEIIPIEFKDPKYWALQFPRKINERLDRLTPEEERQIRNEWSKLLGRTAPIVGPTTCQTQAKAKPSQTD